MLTATTTMGGTKGNKKEDFVDGMAMEAARETTVN
jgi:hypothetical protein